MLDYGINLLPDQTRSRPVQESVKLNRVLSRLYNHNNNFKSADSPKNDIEDESILMTDKVWTGQGTNYNHLDVEDYKVTLKLASQMEEPSEANDDGADDHSSCEELEMYNIHSAHSDNENGEELQNSSNRIASSDADSDELDDADEVDAPIMIQKVNLHRSLHRGGDQSSSSLIRSLKKPKKEPRHSVAGSMPDNSSMSYDLPQNNETLDMACRNTSNLSSQVLSNGHGQHQPAAEKGFHKVKKVL